MSPSLEIALVADVHVGPPVEAKAGPRALETLRALAPSLAGSGADVLIDLGDRINNGGAAQDRSHMEAVADVFRALALERHHLLGNHDVKVLGARENEAILAAPVESRLIRRRGWNLLLWSPEPRFHRDGCIVPEAEIAWLEEALARLDGPTALFSHVPLGGGSMRGNYYFEGEPCAGGTYRELDRLQELVLASDKVKVAVAGHVHWNSLNTLDGLPFLTLQSLSELATTSPEPAGSWAKLQLRDSTATFTVEGNDPWWVTVPLRAEGRHWLRRPGLPARGPRSRGERDAVRGIVLDLDGVIYRGDELLPGAREFLAAVRASGLRVVAVTNHAGYGRQGVVRKLAELGISLAEAEVVTSIDATVSYLHQHHPRGTVRCLGSPSLQRALEEAGFGGPMAADGDGGPPVHAADVVVVGYQTHRDLTALASIAETIRAGAAFVGTNADAWLPSPLGPLPENGPYLAMLTTLSGRQPVITGKPSAVMAALALERLGIRAAEVLVVGDTLTTDVALATTMGATSALVLTGTTRPGDPLVPRPDYVFADLAELTGALHGLQTTSSRRPIAVQPES